jgi:predicted Zn-dependent peptidase
VRVGSADETFLTSGISHLLEHLALFGIGRPGDHSNGFVDQTRMVFHADGDDQEIQHFLDALTRQLTEPPLHRLDAERGVLRAEQAGRGPSLQSGLNSWRYGAAGYGLLGLDQLGVGRVTAAELSSWSACFATRANAVLWLSGPPPAGLRLHLPDGVGQPPPDPRSSILPRSPSWFVGPDDSASFDALVPRGYPALALASILEGRLVDDLRSRRAVAYSPSADYRPLSREVAQLAAYTDLVDGRAPEAVRPFLTALEKLAAEPDSVNAVQPSEITAWVARFERRALDPRYGLALLSEAAWEILHGGTPTEADAAAEQIARVSPQEVADVARQAQGSLLAQVPSGLGPVRDSWSQAPISVHPRLPGRQFHSLHEDERSSNTITLGPSGITLASVDDKFLTIPVTDTVAVLRWNDGRRVLVGGDGVRLLVEPTLWQNGVDLVRQLDSSWPAELSVDQGSRAPDSIPQPSRKPALPAGNGRWLTVAAVVTAGVLVVGALWFILPLLGLDQRLPVAPVFAGGVAAYFGARRRQQENRQD